MWFTAFATATWLALCAGFIQVWLAGTVKVTEHNLAVRALELLVFATLSLWGVYRLLRQLRKLADKQKS